MEVIQNLSTQWGNWMSTADPRVKDWPLVSSPIPTILLVTSYLVGIKSLQKYMKNREPVKWLKPVLVVYNFCLVLLSAWMAIEIFVSSYLGLGYNFCCNNIDYSDNSKPAIRLAFALYVFWLSKFLEFCDTIFMALKKRNDQISFLHVYHHVSMPLLWWFGIKFAAGGDSYWSAMLNSFVHVIMYSYYLLSALGYDIWWKHYLTQLQMFQFSLLMGFSIYSEFDICGPEYTFFLWMRRAMAVYMFSLLVLFGKFYVQAYLDSKNRRKNTRDAVAKKIQ